MSGKKGRSGGKPGQGQDRPYRSPVTETDQFRRQLERRFGLRIPYKQLTEGTGWTRERMRQLVTEQKTCSLPVAAKLQAVIDNAYDHEVVLRRQAAARQALGWWQDRMEGRPESSEAHWGRVSFEEALGLSSNSYITEMLQRGATDAPYRTKIERLLWRIAWS